MIDKTMTKQRERILREKSGEFPRWTRTFQSFLEIAFDSLRMQQAEEENVWTDTQLMYEEILFAMIGMSGVRDEWEEPEFLPLAVTAGLEVICLAEKIESLFYFGTDNLGFFLSTNLNYAENIRKMDDNFWFRMSELSQLGNLDLWEARGYTDAQKRMEPHFHRKTKSKVFQMIRASIALEKHDGSCMDLGSVIVRWSYDTPWELLLEKGALALRNLYKINEALWKKRGKD